MKSTVVAALLIVAGSACGACGRQNFDPPDATIDAAPPPSNIAFVTSTPHSITEFGANLAGADAICNAHAVAAGLPGTYVAWLGLSTQPTRNRLAGARGWTLTDGRPFVDRPEDLTAGVIYNPLAIDENGEDVGTADAVITGTTPGGSTGANCSDWTDNGGYVDVGQTTHTTVSWTASTTQPCASTGRLYCFGTGVARPLMFVPAQGRKAFLSVQPFVPDAGGLATADALCASEASLAGLGGTYRALLATTAISAISRFSLAGPTWVRVDGIPIADTPLTFVAETLRAPLNVTATLDYRFGNSYTGSYNLTSMALGPGEDCSEWTGGGSARIGFVAAADAGFFAYSSNALCSGAPIYCLEP